jgi:NAD(P)-dependent dehydrogenase (short-subunit alcohol dehydrogenase family)
MTIGASRASGKAVAERLAKGGLVVAVKYASSAPDADDVVSNIRAEGGMANKADTSGAGQVEQLFAQTLIQASEPTVSCRQASLFPHNTVAVKHQRCYTGCQWTT